MPGGQYDSSKTRVAPVFDQLRMRQDDWIRQLLSLPSFGTSTCERSTLNLSWRRGNWGREERGLTPPVSLLSWLIRNLSLPVADTESERYKLSLRDPEVIEKALNSLRSEGTGKGWHVLEGPTYPDVVLETPDAIIVIEGKRTEAGVTTETTWMNERHQMWRHIDAAWEIRGHRAVFGFFIVEGQEPDGLQVPCLWREAAALTASPAVVNASLPHRGEQERPRIQSAFLGIVTWQRVCATFELDWDRLPHTC